MLQALYAVLNILITARLSHLIEGLPLHEYLLILIINRRKVRTIFRLVI